MPAKSHKAVVVRGFTRPNGEYAAAVELPAGVVVQADTLTRLQPGTAVLASFDREARAWSATLDPSAA